MLTKIIDEALIQKAKHILSHSERVTLISHMGPDGDAMGSSLAMADFLTGHGKTVKVMFPDQFPEFLAWLPGAKDALVYEIEPEKCEEFLRKSDTVFLIDFNQPSRMGGLSEIVTKLNAKKVLFDHHPDPEDFANVTISYPQIASSSEIVFRYICRSGCFDEMSKSCAECVYTGMMTDTGAFTFNSNDEEMYFIISQLINKGIDKDEIYDKVYNTYSADRMRLMGFALDQRMTIYEEYGTAVIALSKDDLDSFNYKVGDTEGFVNLPLSIKGIVFSVFLRENAGDVKLSFRSKGDFPVNKVASDLFGGGGHMNAAGGEFPGKLKEAVELLVDSLPKYIK